MRCGGLLAAAAALAFLASPALADPSPPKKPPGRRVRPGARVVLKTGQAAPDVALWPLDETTDANGQEVIKIASKPLKLSSYKGRAPVVIFSSSYT